MQRVEAPNDVACVHTCVNSMIEAPPSSCSQSKSCKQSHYGRNLVKRTHRLCYVLQYSQWAINCRAPRLFGSICRQSPTYGSSSALRFDHEFRIRVSPRPTAVFVEGRKCRGGVRSLVSRGRLKVNATPHREIQTLTGYSVL